MVWFNSLNFTSFQVFRVPIYKPTEVRLIFLPWVPKHRNIENPLWRSSWAGFLTELSYQAGCPGCPEPLPGLEGPYT